MSTGSAGLAGLQATIGKKEGEWWVRQGLNL